MTGATRTTINAELAARLAADPDGAYLDFMGDAYSARRIDDQAGRLAAVLAGIGVGRGDRVASLVENGPEQVVTFFATLRLGAIAVPVNTAYKGEFLRHQLADSGARVVVVQGDFAGRVAEIATGAAELEAAVVVGEADAAITTIASLDYRALVTAVPNGMAPVEVAPGDLACLIYTAGTTGPSKGCMLSHNYVVGMARQIARAWQRTADDVVWTPLPLFHLNAISIAVVGTLSVGGAASIARRFSVSGFWPEVRRSGATITSMLGSLAILVANADDHDEQPGHRLRLCAAAPMPPDIDRIWRERFGCATFSGGFGLTEASLLAALPPGEENRPGAAGRPNDVELEVRILDDDDVEAAVGEVGELCCRPRHPDTMFAGYWNRPADTLGALRNLWFHTGDLARVDADGFLYFVDRKKDALRRRGENISSFEMEKTFFAHTAILDVAVHAVPSEMGEDEVKVTCVLQPGAVLTAEELCRWAAERVPYFAIPRYVEFRDDLPRNPVGRVLKYELRAQGVTTATWDREAAGVTFERR
jgi:Acyl-CoA synthetases (AMP-forming)/AMP-acid ligases II